MTAEITKKLKSIQLLLLDVDGVLTDGSIVYNDHCEETKIFNVKDGLGIRLLMEAGIGVGLVTGRRSDALHHRCKDLGIIHIYDGVSDKAAILKLISEQTNVAPEKMAFVGDDLPDLPLMRRVGVSIAVADAHEAVIEKSAWVTSAGGGAGAVREICEAILKTQGLWEKILGQF